MEDNVTRDFLAAILKDPSHDPRRLSPNWLESAFVYRRPVYATDDQVQWPAPDTSAVTQPPSPSDAAISAQPDIGTGRARIAMRMANAGRGVVDAIRGQNEFDHPEVVPGIMSGRDLGDTVARNVQARGETGLQFLANLRSARGEEGLLDVLKSYDPDAQTMRDRYGNTIVTFGGQPYYLNRSGLSDRDLEEGVRDTVFTAPFSGMAGRVTQGANFLRRAGGQAMAGLFGAAASDANSARAGSQQGFDVVAAGTNAGTMAAFEALPYVRGLGRMMRGTRNVPQVRANRPQELWDPPTDLPQRPIELDYPRGVPVNATGQITHTIEGQPIHAQRVFGRVTKDGPEYSLQPGDHDILSNGFMGKPAMGRATEEMGGNLGTSSFYGNQLTEISLDRGMHPLDWFKAYAHELGHAIDEFAGQLPTKGLLNELKLIYNTLNNPNRTSEGLRALPGRPITPKDFRYPSDEVPREYAVEAIRAYMTNPNYMKSVAPRTARAIREFVNSHPRLSRIVQFNSLIGAPAAIGSLRAVDQVDRGL